MAFQIIDNIEVPAIAATRVRPRGEFAQAVDSLKIGQGFLFDSDKSLKAHYPKVSPSKFPSDEEGYNKKFRLWIAGEGKVGVKRLADVAVGAPGADAEGHEGQAGGQATDAE